MIRILASLALLAAVAVPHASASAQSPSPPVVAAFDDATISRLLLDLGATWRIEPNGEGRSNYRASAQNGVSFVLAPAACSADAGCQGLVMIAVFNGLEIANQSQLAATLNAINDQSPTAKVLRSPDGNVILQSYMNAAFGISYANAQAQLLVFGEDIALVGQALSSVQPGG